MLGLIWVLWEKIMFLYWMWNTVIPHLQMLNDHHKLAWLPSASRYESQVIYRQCDMTHIVKMSPWFVWQVEMWTHPWIAETLTVSILLWWLSWAHGSIILNGPVEFGGQVRTLSSLAYSWMFFASCQGALSSWGSHWGWTWSAAEFKCVLCLSYHPHEY